MLPPLCSFLFYLLFFYFSKILFQAQNFSFLLHIMYIMRRKKPDNPFQSRRDFIVHNHYAGLHSFSCALTGLFPFIRSFPGVKTRGWVPAVPTGLCLSHFLPRVENRGCIPIVPTGLYLSHFLPRVETRGWGPIVPTGLCLSHFFLYFLLHIMYIMRHFRKI